MTSTSSLFPVAVKSLGITAGLLVLLFQYLMGQLHIQAIEMKHMDPTDIVLVPLELDRLTVYVAVVSVASWVSAMTNGGTLLSLLIHWISAASAFFAIAIVCGASPTEHLYHTELACLYISSLAILLTTTNNGSSTAISPGVSWWESRLALPLLATKKTHDESAMVHFHRHLLATCQTHALLFVTIPFQILRLYDWGSQIQRWPLPIMLGSTYGFVLGTIGGWMGILALQCSPRLRNGYASWTSTTIRSTTVDNNKRLD
ncbi:expressed unknown protein [Seminavis robusta]|uniref:Uncharacterized protein n=1 Tax=Seminavis robusta TaxID=568900 RepID=A0A9N8E774_9STRA|nr:expressed unknown protein [Seminavis robusta]|eukprot:Sro724_g193150.1 n/a (259) ;mRNA; f:24138-25004